MFFFTFSVQCTHIFSWNDDKDIWLQKNRLISFSEIVDAIAEGHLLGRFINTSSKHKGQEIFVVQIKGYSWVVPFTERDGSYCLITAFPSRKFKKLAGGENGKK